MAFGEGVMGNNETEMRRRVAATQKKWRVYIEKQKKRQVGMRTCINMTADAK